MQLARTEGCQLDLELLQEKRRSLGGGRDVNPYLVDALGILDRARACVTATDQPKHVVLDRLRGEFDAAEIHELVPAAEDPEPPGSQDHADVAGMKPAVSEGAAGRIGIAEIVAVHVGRADPELAALAPRQPGAPIVDRLDFGEGRYGGFTALECPRDETHLAGTVVVLHHRGEEGFRALA